MDDFHEIIAKDWYGHTTLHPLAIVMLIIVMGAVLSVRRTYAAVPFLILACFVSPVQRIMVGGLNFPLMRLLVLAGWVRVLTRSEQVHLRWTRTDTLMACYTVSAIVVYTLQQQCQMSEFVYRTGAMYDVVGMYYLFRCFVREWEDLRCIALASSIIAVPVAACFLIERATGRNMFAIFGGVAAVTWIRDGQLRCQGAFAHPIIAGCFWAALLPLMAAQLWRTGAARVLGATGFVCSLVVIACCSSSTPVSGVILAALGGAMFVLRRWMGSVCVASVIGLCVLHITMNKPVWHLLARLDLVGGSTGYHRYLLIDQAIHHFGEWYMLGTPSTADWGDGLFDVTNQYVLEGVRGGLLTLLLFLAVIWTSYASVGRLWRRAPDIRGQFVAWSLGVGLFVHTTSFLALSYFGLQIDMLWFLNLAVIASLISAQPVVSAKDAPVLADVPRGLVPIDAHSLTANA